MHGSAPDTERQERAAAGAGEQLAILGAILRLLQSDQDTVRAIEQALIRVHDALSLSSARLIHMEAGNPRTVVGTGAAQDPAPHTRGEYAMAQTAGDHIFQTRLAGNEETGWLLDCRRERGGSFAGHDVQLLTVLSSILASHLDKVRLIGELRDAEEDALHALAASLASRDRYTGAHVDAVCTYAERLGQRLGLHDHDLRLLRIGGILHDIGKVGVNDAILQKSGPLTESEMMQMRQHTIIGAQIVRNVRRLQAALPIVLYHHERWDGKGYPTGLAGEQIPFGARIVAVVDSFHAMTSARPYRPARSYAEALDELRRCAGTHFDPSIVTAFVELIGETDDAFP